MGELALIPVIKKYLDKECQCNSSQMIEFYSYLDEHKKDVLIISTDSRTDFIHSYMSIVHQKDVSFKKQQGEFLIQNALVSSEKLNYYYIN